MSQWAISFTEKHYWMVLIGAKWATRRVMKQQDYAERPTDLEPPYAVGSTVAIKEPVWMPTDTMTIHGKVYEAGVWQYTWDYRPPTDAPWVARKLNGRFMPKIAARRWVVIEHAEPQRLHEMDDEDARAEGVGLLPEPGATVEAFSKIWDEINGKTHPWASNPWVWAYSLRLHSTTRGIVRSLPSSDHAHSG